MQDGTSPLVQGGGQPLEERLPLDDELEEEVELEVEDEPPDDELLDDEVEPLDELPIIPDELLLEAIQLNSDSWQAPPIGVSQQAGLIPGPKQTK